jgi:hypothetical protein
MIENTPIETSDATHTKDSILPPSETSQKLAEDFRRRLQGVLDGNKENASEPPLEQHENKVRHTSPQ